MKEITSVIPNGINYVDEEGNQQFIDFESCHQNNLMDVEKRWGSQYTDEAREFWQRAKYVGIRFTLSDPPAIEFYTVPRIRFEFSTRDRLYEILTGIKKAGWRTNDGE